MALVWTAIVVVTFGIATPNSAEAAGAQLLTHGPRDSGSIALTFDDGVSPANCRRILAILLERHVPATFFPIAEAMRLDPAFWRLVAESGFPVGDHTLTHPQMPGLSEAGQFHEIDAGRRLAESILGRSLLRVLRPPYGAWNAATLTAAAQAGFGVALNWDVSDRDTSRQGTVDQMVAAAEQGAGGSIVLMHCGPNATPYVLGRVIDFYQAHGFRFVTVPSLLGLAWTHGTIAARTPAEILAGLSPLPATPSGGPITGPNGYVPPKPEPTTSSRPAPASATPVPPTARPSTAPRSASPSPAAGSPAAGSPSQSASQTAATPTPEPVAASGNPRAASGDGPTGGLDPAVLRMLAVAIAVTAAGISILLLVRQRSAG